MKRDFLKGVGLVLLWLATVNSCSALLGENESQLEQRCGKSIPELNHRLGPLVVRCYFVRDVVMTTVMLRRGKSICELYARYDKQPLTEHTITAMLKGNSHANEWKEIPAGEGVSRQWMIAKKKIGAAYFAAGVHPGMAVYTASWVPYARNYAQEQEPARSKSVQP